MIPSLWTRNSLCAIRAAALSAVYLNDLGKQVDDDYFYDSELIYDEEEFDNGNASLFNKPGHPGFERDMQKMKNQDT